MKWFTLDKSDDETPPTTTSQEYEDAMDAMDFNFCTVQNTMDFLKITESADVQDNKKDDRDVTRLCKLSQPNPPNFTEQN